MYQFEIQKCQQIQTAVNDVYVNALSVNLNESVFFLFFLRDTNFKSDDTFHLIILPVTCSYYLFCLFYLCIYLFIFEYELKKNTQKFDSLKKYLK